MTEKFKFPLSLSMRVSPIYGVTGECRNLPAKQCLLFEGGVVTPADVDNTLRDIEERGRSFVDDNNVFHQDVRVLGCGCGARVKVYFDKDGVPRLHQIQ